MKLFLIFLFYAFLGWCFEMVHMGITTKEVVNRGFLLGPVIPIYGVGMTAIILLLNPIKQNFIITTMIITLICGVLEYATSYVMEKIFGIRWWDYSDKKYNLNGRVCFETMILFVIMAIIVIYFVHPIFINILNNLTIDAIKNIFYIVFVIFVGDFIVSNFIASVFSHYDDKSGRKDKTPVIREFTTNLLKRS